MAELLESNHGTRIIAADVEEIIGSIGFNIEDEGYFMRYESSESLANMFS